MPDRLPPLNALRAFEAAARLLSFKLAAAELSVTPTAISHQIRGLEEYLGVSLFHRLTRALELTSEGKAMLPKVHEGMECFSAAVARVRKLKPGVRLRVVAPPSFSSRWLMPRLHRFSERAPDVELHLRGSVKAIDEVRAGAGDSPDRSERRNETPQVWIRFGKGHYAGMRVDHLFEPEYTVVCSPELLERRTPLATPADLRHFTLIHDETIPEATERPGWKEWLEAAGASDVKASGPHFSASGLATAAVLDGLGVALLAKPMVEAEIAAGRLVAPFPISIRRSYAYYVVSPESVADEPQVAAFRDWLLEEARHVSGATAT